MLFLSLTDNVQICEQDDERAGVLLQALTTSGKPFSFKVLFHKNSV